MTSSNFIPVLVGKPPEPHSFLTGNLLILPALRGQSLQSKRLCVPHHAVRAILWCMCRHCPSIITWVPGFGDRPLLRRTSYIAWKVLICSYFSFFFIVQVGLNQCVCMHVYKPGSIGYYGHSRSFCPPAIYSNLYLVLTLYIVRVQQYSKHVTRRT